MTAVLENASFHTMLQTRALLNLEFSYLWGSWLVSDLFLDFVSVFVFELSAVYVPITRVFNMNHVIAKGLIEGYQVFLPHFEALSDSYCFRFDFHDKEIMARFALSLKDKPFVRSIGKIFGKNALFVHIYLPRGEFRGFTDSLSKLIRNGQLKNYDYVIEDPSRRELQTISYELFKDKSWIYGHKEHMKRLHELAI